MQCSTCAYNKDRLDTSKYMIDCVKHNIRVSFDYLCTNYTATDNTDVLVKVNWNKETDTYEIDGVWYTSSGEKIV